MLLLVFYLFKSGKLDFQAFGNFVKNANTGIILLIILLLLACNCLFAKRYQFFINTAGFIEAKFLPIFNIVMVGVFYNNFLPGGTGGDLMRIYYIKKTEGVPLSVGSAITILDRIVGLLGLVFVAMLSLIFVLVVSSSSIRLFQEQKLLIILIIAIPVLTVISILLLRYERIYRLIETLLSKLFFGEKLVNFLEMFQTLVKNSTVLIKSFCLCVAGHTLTITAISIIAYLLYDSQAIYATLAVAGIVLLTTAVPVTPGNIGLTEWFADALYRLFGMEGGATIFAMWRVMSIFFSLLGGVIYLKAGRKEFNTKEQ